MRQSFNPNKAMLSFMKLALGILVAFTLGVWGIFLTTQSRAKSFDKTLEQVEVANSEKAVLASKSGDEVYYAVSLANMSLNKGEEYTMSVNIDTKEDGPKEVKHTFVYKGQPFIWAPVK